MKITKQDLVQLIKEELDIMLSEQPRPGSLGARAAQRARDRASQGLGQTPTEKRVQAKTTGAGRPSGQSTAEQERRVAGAATGAGFGTGGAGAGSAAFNKNPAAGVNVGARTRPGASTQSFADQVKRAGAYKGPEDVRTGGAGMDSAAFTKPTKPATAATKSAAPKSRKAGSKDAYFKTLSRMSDRGTIKPWQQKKLDAYKASQTPAKPAAAKPVTQAPAKPAAAKPVTDSGAGPMSPDQTKAEDDVLKNLTAQGALGEHLETIVNEILSRLNQ